MPFKVVRCDENSSVLTTQKLNQKTSKQTDKPKKNKKSDLQGNAVDPERPITVPPRGTSDASEQYREFHKENVTN